jgi:hypothetical protein
MSITSRIVHAARARACHALIAGLVLVLVMPVAELSAQDRRDFLIGAPSVTLTLRGGMNVLRQNSDIYEHVREFLTIDRGDLLGFSGIADLGIRVSDRFDIVASLGYSRSATWSEDREFVEQDDSPIEQHTSLVQVPLTMSAKLYLQPRGRAIGRFAYVPAAGLTPYIGAGGGALWHRFAQDGHFVDYESLRILQGRLETAGFAPLLHGFAGVDVRIAPRLSLTLEGRYNWSHAAMGSDFVGFDRIDLSGLQTTAGIQIRL